MSRNSISTIALITLLLVNGSLLALLFRTKSLYERELLLKEVTAATLNHRYREHARIGHLLPGNEVIPFSGAITGSGEVIDSTSADRFRSAYILVINGNTCSTCIPEAFSICSQLFDLESSHSFFVVGDFSTPSAMFQMMERNGLSRGYGVFSVDLARHFSGEEEIPVLIKLDDDLKVTSACFIEKHTPEEFYRLFMSF